MLVHNLMCVIGGRVGLIFSECAMQFDTCEGCRRNMLGCHSRRPSVTREPGSLSLSSFCLIFLFCFVLQPSVYSRLPAWHVEQVRDSCVDMWLSDVDETITDAGGLPPYMSLGVSKAQCRLDVLL